MGSPKTVVTFAGAGHQISHFSSLVGLVGRSLATKIGGISAQLFQRSVQSPEGTSKAGSLYLERKTRRSCPSPATKFALLVLSRFFPWLSALAIVKPDTFVRGQVCWSIRVP